jgi:hypothetical protein
MLKHKAYAALLWGGEGHIPTMQNDSTFIYRIQSCNHPQDGTFATTTGSNEYKEFTVRDL